MMRGLLSSFTSNSVRSQLTQGLPFSCSLMFFLRTLEKVFVMFVYVIRMHFLSARIQIDFGKITTSLSCVVRSYLSCTKTTGLIFYCFSGIVEAVKSTSPLEDLLSVSDLDAIKTEGEKTLPSDASLSKFSRVNVKEICEKVITQLVRNRASLKVICMYICYM